MTEQALTRLAVCGWAGFAVMLAANVFQARWWASKCREIMAIGEAHCREFRAAVLADVEKWTGIKLPPSE